jgi:SNF2 family DNA or RNA helicase
MAPSLHAYQHRAADHVIANNAAALFLDVGLGKSAATLTALRRMFDTGEILSALVIAPKTVAEETWPTERGIWAGDVPMRLITGTPKERMAAVMDPAPLHVIGIDNVSWLVEMFSGKWPYDTVILDESQKFKDPSAKRFKALKKVRKHFERVILLSATPASESLMGLWAQVFLTDGGQRLGKTFTSFKEAFFACDYMGWNWAPRPGAEQAIHQRISDMALSMRAEDYLDLPERIDNRIEVHLDNASRRAYAALERDYLMQYRGEVVTAANAAVLAGKLLQLTSGQVYDEDRNVVEVHEGKINALEALVDAMNGNPLLVFYQFRHEVDLIEARIKGAEPIDVTRWNRGEQKVAYAHPKSAGAGLNLQHGGATMCWYSLPWSLDLYIQACGRLHRQGQKRSVVIHHLIVPESIDEDVMVALAAKKDGQDRLLEALKRRIKE